RVEEIPPASRETGFAVVGGGVHPLQKELHEDGGAQGDAERSVRLLEAQIGVTKKVPDDHQRREVPQREEPQVGISIGVEKNCGVERGCFHRVAPPSIAASLTGLGLPSSTVCQPGASFKAVC